MALFPERSIRSRCIVLGFIVLGCASGNRPKEYGAAGGPTLRLLDSIILQEPDSLFIGLIRQGIAVDEIGNLFVGSATFRAVLRFDREGRLTGSYHLDEYSGPSSVGPVVFAGDSMVIVSDSRASRLAIFRSSDGQSPTTRRYRGYMGSVALVGGMMWFGNLSASQQRIAGAVVLADLISADSQAVTGLLQPTLIEVPEEFERYSELVMGSQVLVNVTDGMLVVGFSALNLLMRMSLTSGHLDTIQPPRRLRRGVSTQALRKYFVKRRFRYDLALGSISVTDGLWRRPNGQLVLVHMDSRAYMKEGRLVGVSATPFVSLLTPDLARACVDGLIEAPEAARPAVAILGDTLYVVDQRTKAGGSSSETVLRRFLIDESTCSWVSIDRSEG
jgi:hypothetical protein